MSPTLIVAYLALFSLLGAVFLGANLLLGRFLRPNDPHAEKLEIYECGEPTIGSSFVQFDLRFYVVALLFIIFDVEVAFFFPWAAVYGKVNHLRDPAVATAESSPAAAIAEGASPAQLSAAGAGLLRDLGVAEPTLPLPAGGVAENRAALAEAGRKLALASIGDIAVFFGVLMVGFAYVWRRGDLDWVRAVSHARASGESSKPPLNDELLEREPALAV